MQRWVWGGVGVSMGMFNFFVFVLSLQQRKLWELSLFNVDASKKSSCYRVSVIISIGKMETMLCIRHRGQKQLLLPPTGLHQ